tara:strand:- start:1372 stop:2067 length:696 start_codon:yes stop_codon:yes gene_type:complete
MRFVSVIPARAGSKGLKNKNTFNICGKSLIEYTFEAAKKSKVRNNFVLTDSSKIKQISKKFGINCSYIRPKLLSGDKTSLSETLYDFYLWTEKNNIFFDYLIVLQPTSPLRDKNDINKSIDIIKKNKTLSLFSISSSIEHPYETIEIKGKKSWQYILKGAKKFTRRQDFNLVSYFINGAIYIVHRKLVKKKKISDPYNNSFYEMAKSKSIEINDLEETKIIKSIIKFKKND